MTKDQFRDALCVLRSIERLDLDEIGLFTSGEIREKLLPSFRSNPYECFILMTDEQANKVWSIIERQMPRSGPSANHAVATVGGQ